MILRACSDLNLSNDDVLWEILVGLQALEYHSLCLHNHLGLCIIFERRQPLLDGGITIRSFSNNEIQENYAVGQNDGEPDYPVHVVLSHGEELRALELKITQTCPQDRYDVAEPETNLFIFFIWVIFRLIFWIHCFYLLRPILEVSCNLAIGETKHSQNLCEHYDHDEVE